MCHRRAAKISESLKIKKKWLAELVLNNKVSEENKKNTTREKTAKMMLYKKQKNIVVFLAYILE